METQTITVDTADGPMALYEAKPGAGDAPATRGVVLVQEAFGVNDHMEEVSRRIAGLGYHVVAPHLFHRAGGGTVPYGQFDKVLEKFAGLDDDGLLVDIDASLAVLADAGISAARTGIVGFCMGGRVTFLVAARRALGAAVGFYGGGIVEGRFPQFPALIDEAPMLQTPWLGLFGDEDQSIPVEQVERLREALVAAPVATEVVRYAGAGHGFFRDIGEGYHAEASADAWARLQSWYDTHIGA
jgi:carboxymethylenebutenolidase